MRLCPCCRLPFPPSWIHVGEEGGRFVVFALCGHCGRRFRRLPAGVLHKLLNGVSARAAADSARYWAALFPDAGLAMLAAGLLSHPTHFEQACDAIGWRAQPA